jgi:hypothetical protein
VFRDIPLIVLGELLIEGALASDQRLLPLSKPARVSQR